MTRAVRLARGLARPNVEIVVRVDRVPKCGRKSRGKVQIEEYLARATGSGDQLVRVLGLELGQDNVVHWRLTALAVRTRGLVGSALAHCEHSGRAVWPRLTADLSGASSNSVFDLNRYRGCCSVNAASDFWPAWADGPEPSRGIRFASIPIRRDSRAALTHHCQSSEHLCPACRIIARPKSVLSDTGAVHLRGRNGQV